MLQEHSTRNWHPIPYHKLVMPHIIIRGILAILSVVLFMIRVYSTTIRYLFLLPIIAMALWDTISFFTWNIQVWHSLDIDPITQHHYIADTRVYWLAGMSGYRNQLIEWENRCIDVINKTEIPYIIPDGRCVIVDCSYMDRSIIEFTISYPQQYDITKQLCEIFPVSPENSSYVHMKRHYIYAENYPQNGNIILAFVVKIPAYLQNEIHIDNLFLGEKPLG